MLHKRHNSVVTLAVLLTLVGVSKPAKAFLLAQSDTAPTTFTVPEKLSEDAAVKIATSNSADSINNSLKDSFATKYPQAEVNIETQDSDTALKSVSDGRADLAAIGRNLTAEEKAEGFTAVPVSREKIAIVVSPANSYDGNLTIGQFAQIFRGEITDWAEIGGTPGKIKLVDLPQTNDTRQAFPNYPVFQAAEFTTGETATQLDQDSTDAAIEQLEENSISYAVANDVINRDDVKIVTMHQTQPDDPRYPFSQPFNLVYQGTPSEAAKAYIGYATAEGGREVIANRTGSVLTAATASAIGAGSNTLETLEPEALADDVEGTATPEVDVEAENAADLEPGGIADPNAIADARVNGDVEGSGELNADIDGSGEVNADLNNSGEANADLNDSGEVNVDLNDSGEVNVDLNDSGELNPEIEGSGEVLSADPVEGEGEVVVPNDGGEQVAEKKGGKWWLLLIPLLAIPLLGVMFLGGRKRSDREPAIDNVPPSANSPGGGINPNISNGGDVPPVGANASGNLGNASNINRASMGAAGLAGGAALGGAANLAGNRRAEVNDLDLDLDDSITAEEIPSTPVTEFTGPETGLQAGDTKSELQDEDIDLDLKRSESGDGFNGNLEANTESVVESPSNADYDLDGDAEGEEFLGDFVLPEEGRDISVTNNSNVDRGTGFVEGATADGAASGFNREDRVTDAEEIVDVDEQNENLDLNVDLDLGERPDGSANLTGDIIEVEATDLDSQTNLADSSLNTDIDSDSATTSELNLADVDVDTNVDDASAGNAVIAGGAALGGAAAVSGFFNRDRDGEDVAEGIDRADSSQANFDSDLDLSDRAEADGSVNLTEDTLVDDSNIGAGTNVVESNRVDFDSDLDLSNRAEADGSVNLTEDTLVDDSNIDAGTNVVESNRVDFDSDLDLSDRAEADRSVNLTEDTNVIDLRSEGESTSFSQSTDIDLDGETATSELDSSELDTNLDLDRSDAIIAGGAVDTEAYAAESDRDLSLDLDLDSSEFREDTSANLMGGIGEVKTSNLDTGIDATDSSQDTDIDLDSDTSELDLSSLDLDLDDRSETVERTTTAADTEVNTTDSDRDSIDFTSDLDLDDRSQDASADPIGDIDLSLDDTSELDLSSIDSDTNRGAGGAALGGAALGGIAASGFLDGDTEKTSEIQEFETFETSFDVSADSKTSSFADNVVADAETTAVDDNNLQDMTVDRLAESEDVTLEEITFDDERTINASLEDISFDDVDSEINLDEITLDETEVNLDSSSTNDLTPTGRYEDIRLEDLGFADAEPVESASLDLESKSADDKPADDRSNDMNNISQWLDSLDSNQDSDNISDWLDTLDRDSFNSNTDLADSNQENTDLTEEEDDISFQFLEDLLDRDEDSNRDR